jgi:D-alanyl-D-alanine carboxypeptidase (penicillin-binding protein 5/6)
MRKRLFASVCTIMISVTLLGCSGDSQELLTFKTSAASQSAALDYTLTQSAFFAEDLVTVTNQENQGEDTNIASGASLLINVTDKELLYADNVYDRLYPASLTKLMTALVVLKYGELTDDVTISYAASHITESGAKLCGFAEGDVIAMDALLRCLLIYSGNDAAVAIADHVGGDVDSFVAMMNKEAKEIGAVHTNYVNPSGLHDDNQYTTAYDIYLVFNELLQYDIFRAVISTDSYTATYQNKDGERKEKTFQATNQYLSGNKEIPEGIEIIGGKTGTTRKAGNCLVLLSKDRDKKEYISVLLNSDNSDALYSQMTYLLLFINN